MKLVLKLDANGDDLIDQDYTIEWPLSVIPRVGEQLFIDELIPSKPAFFVRDILWEVWSVDYRWVESENTIVPHLWMQDVESNDK